MHSRQSFPSFAAIVRTVDFTSLLVFYTPYRHEHRVGILRIENDVVNYVVIALTEMSETRPAMAAVFRLKDRPCTRAQKNVIRIARIRAQTTSISAVRSQNRPLTGPQCRCTKHHDT